jgi:hypothetical protein
MMPVTMSEDRCVQPASSRSKSAEFRSSGHFVKSAAIIRDDDENALPKRASGSQLLALSRLNA